MSDKISNIMSTTQNNTAEIDGVCDMLNNICTADNEDGISVCANCGKGEGSNLKACLACKLVKYCNRECQVAHRVNIKKNVRSVQRSYTMKNYSNNLRQRRIVRSVSYESLHFIQVLNISRVVDKLYVVAVFMRLFTMTKAMKLIMKSVHFAELHILLQMKM